MDNAPAVKCAVHGEHGTLSNGRCWYCVQEGRSIEPAATPSISESAATPTTTTEPKQSAIERFAAALSKMAPDKLKRMLASIEEDDDDNGSPPPQTEQQPPATDQTTAGAETTQGG